MTASIAESYDRAATRYRDWWGPVIAATAVRLLDRLGGLLDGQPGGQLADVGTGTGVVALAALKRWPQLRVVGIDPSAGMRAVAAEHAAAAGPQAQARLTLVAGDAAAIPLPDASCDAAVSSFVLQLVPNRAAALGEMLRILRPDAQLAAVTWVGPAEPFEPLDAFDDAADALALPDAASAYEPQPFDSVRDAIRELRAAGFVEVEGRGETVERQFAPDEYLSLLEQWERDDVFEPLDERERDDLRSETRRRWRELPPDAFHWRGPVVSLLGRRASR